MPLKLITLFISVLLVRCFMADATTAVPLTYIFMGVLAISGLFSYLYTD